MAVMPEGVALIYNPVTAAPGFKIKNVFVLPGVPKIMEIMFLEVLNNIQKGKPKIITTINTDLYESKIASFLNDIQKKYKDCSIGSYPYFNFVSKIGGVNIVISSWSLTKLDHITDEIKHMISLLGGKSLIV